jgi:hypothetical protein
MDKLLYLQNADPALIEELYTNFRKDPESVGFLVKVKEMLENPSKPVKNEEKI